MLKDYCVPDVPNIANEYTLFFNKAYILILIFSLYVYFRLTSINDVCNILDVWLIDLNSARTKTISKLKTLERASMNDLEIVCHLQHGTTLKKLISRKRQM